MNAARLLGAALGSLYKNRMRSVLTMLGVVIGVAAVIVMVAVGRGAQRDIEDRIASLGTNLIIVFPSWSSVGGVSRGGGGRTALTLDDVEFIEERATLLAAVSPSVSTGVQAVGGGTNWATSLQGVAPSYPEIRNWRLESGSFFGATEMRSRAKVAVLGTTVAEALFPGGDPIGAQIRLRNVPFTVVGVLASRGQSGMGGDQDDVILAPATTVAVRLTGDRRTRQIYASAASAADVPAALEELRTLLRLAHKLAPSEEDDFQVRDQAEITETASATSKTLTMLLGSIAAVSLLVGGIGIMNIMLVSVTERTREIGLRLAVGARARDVLAQFLVEAVALSCLGGLVGIALAVGGTWALERFGQIPTDVEAPIVVTAFAFSAAVGVVFGFWPARTAAGLDPIEALRHE